MLVSTLYSIALLSLHCYSRISRPAPEFTTLNCATMNLASDGVSQGSLIGSPCFSINVNDKPDCTRSVADDLHTLLAPLLKGSYEKVDYSIKNKFTLHLDKILLFPKKQVHYLTSKDCNYQVLSKVGN